MCLANRAGPSSARPMETISLTLPWDRACLSFLMHGLYLEMIHAFCTNMIQGSIRRGGATLCRVLNLMEGSHCIVSTTRKRDHTVLYHPQGGVVTQYCFYYKKEGSCSIVTSTSRRGHTVLYPLQGGCVTQHCIIYMEEGSCSNISFTRRWVTQYWIIYKKEW